MAKCCVCGKEVNPGADCEVRFTGRTKYICFDCIKTGNGEIEGRRSTYFTSSYEGQKRLKNASNKRRGK